jgi:hypothetical protein
MERKPTISGVLLLALLVAVARSASASTTWYVNGVSGSDSNNCRSSLTACKTIGHAISLAASGDFIVVAAGTYTEHLTIGISLNVIGSGASTTIVDGGLAGRVANIPNSGTSVTLSNVTIRNGLVAVSVGKGGGIYNAGTLTINNCTITNNQAHGIAGNSGGGIYNAGNLTINNSTVSRNHAYVISGGGGIYNSGSLRINNSTLSGNSASVGGAINGGTITIYNSTISANNAYVGGAISNGSVVIVNSTLSGNRASKQGGGVNTSTLSVFSSTLSGNSAAQGGSIFTNGFTTIMQNSIVANSPSGGNCNGTIASRGYNMSSDATCNFHNSGDRNSTNAMLGPLQNNGGPTQTMALPSGSPAVDAGNPSGCTDAQGHLLTTDQRGYPRHDPEDPSGCDMGAYERQSD